MSVIFFSFFHFVLFCFYCCCVFHQLFILNQIWIVVGFVENPGLDYGCGFCLDQIFEMIVFLEIGFLIGHVLMIDGCFVELATGFDSLIF